MRYEYCSSIMAGTEATMYKTGRLFVDAAHQSGGTIQWHGCIDHFLELITGIAMKDYEGSEGYIAAAARALVDHFSSSSQAKIANFATSWFASQMYPRFLHPLVVYLFNV